MSVTERILRAQFTTLLSKYSEMKRELFHNGEIIQQLTSSLVKKTQVKLLQGTAPGARSALVPLKRDNCFQAIKVTHDGNN